MMVCQDTGIPIYWVEIGGNLRLDGARLTEAIIRGTERATREHPLRWIWEESPAFNRFRDESWMPEPCKSCDRRTRDFGACAHAFPDASLSIRSCRLSRSS